MMEELSGDCIEKDSREEFYGNTSLTYAKINLQWIMNKAKVNTDVEYFDRIQFAKFKLERACGKKVKINIQR